MSNNNSPGRIPGIVFGTSNLERVILIFNLKEQNLSSTEIAKQLGISRQAVDYHIKRNAEYICKYRRVLETFEEHRNSLLIPPELREAIEQTLNIFPKLAAA